jgi:signal transduction histidine kinase
MLTFHDVETFVYGAAAVVDAAVLLVLIERRNWGRVISPLLVLVAGAAVYHGGVFVHVLLRGWDGPGAPTFQLLAMLAMGGGLLLLPCAALHSLWHLRRRGFDVSGTADRRVAIVYLPLFALIPAGAELARAPLAPFLETLAVFVFPYLAVLTAAVLVTAAGVLRLRRRLDEMGQRAFLSFYAAALLFLAAVLDLAFVAAIPSWPETRRVFILAGTFAPVILSLVVAYAILRYGLMQVVLKRTVIYSALVVGLVLLHRLVLQNVWANLGERYHLDFVVLEVALILALVALYRPFRERAAEALHYLLGERVAETRARARRLALEMSGMFGEPPEAILAWFQESVQTMLGVRHVSAWLFAPNGETIAQSGETSRLEAARVLAMHRALAARELSTCTRSDAPTRGIAHDFDTAEASVALVLAHPSVDGVLLLGPRPMSRDLSGEQLNAVSMLIEQLGITVNNSMLQGERLAAERRALLNEKLSTLGLIAGSIAHEVKNPLSSIKTIAAVMAEELGEQAEHAEDLRLIVEEVDRLSTTVTNILRFARPSESPGSAASPVAAVNGTLQIMHHVAKQHDVALDVDLAAGLPEVRCDENALREIVFNLLANAIRAAGVGGRVGLRGRHEDGRVAIDVTDNGPGIPPEIQARMYEPFASGHDDGTGLGLYVVSRRLREVGGEIHCQTGSGSGTTFTVLLPEADAG